MTSTSDGDATGEVAPDRSIPSPDFPVVRRGYDREAVRAYVAQAHAELSRLASDNWDLRRELTSAKGSSASQVLIDLKAELAIALAKLDDVQRQRNQPRDP